MTVLDQILGAPQPPPFALIHRPENATGKVDVLLGEVSMVERIADFPGDDVLALIPYRQLAERGFDCPDDGTPLVAMRITARDTVPVADIRAGIQADVPVELKNERFDIDDAAYADLVRRVLTDEIGRGEGANFVLKRSFLADIDAYTPAHALAVFARLLRDELGAYWTFVVHTGDRTLIGASPERHVSASGGVATMNPISGTYRYPADGVSVDGVLEFLADRKESDELYMVLDEELKMMGRVCDGGGRVVGPQLKPMARLAHTEYFIEGRSTMDARRILHETLFAPTVTGSPLESACRVVARYEPEGRAYYSGVLALIGRDAAGAQTLDSAILIRTADISKDGRLRIDVGATLVRHSDPDSEVAETRAKAATLLAAFTSPGQLREPGPTQLWAHHPEVQQVLQARNAKLAGYWLGGAQTAALEHIQGRRALVVDCEDTFTSMLGHQLASIGLDVTVRRFDEQPDVRGYDLVVMGPGPGDPRDVNHPKIATMRRMVRQSLDQRLPLLAICLGHQVLSTLLGFPLVRRPAPNQGTQVTVDFFGRDESCGFYNSFAAVSRESRVALPSGLGTAEISQDPVTGEVHAMRGAGFSSLQFHPESVLTQNGVEILRELVGDLLPAPALSA
jgi:2-amino-4-deoxychorismate synthase